MMELFGPALDLEDSEMTNLMSQEEMPSHFLSGKHARGYSGLNGATPGDDYFVLANAMKYKDQTLFLSI